MDLPACALAGLEVKGLLSSSCSSEKRVLWRGGGFAHPMPLKTAVPKLLVVSPPYVHGSQPPSPTSLVCFSWFGI